MLRRFFYFPTPTFEGCDTDLETVKFDDCNPEIRLSEIRRIFVAKIIAAPFTDWTADTEWLARLSDASTAGDDYIRTLVVRGNKPAPAGVVKDLTNNRKKTVTKNHTINFLIDEVTEENHEFLRQLEAGGQVKVWYETHGGLMLGGNSGIDTYMRIDMVLNEGPEEIMTYNGVIEWKSLFTEERTDSPIFDEDQSDATFAITIEFNTAATHNTQGVTATIAAVDPDIEFHFNAINPHTGAAVTMDINLGGVQIMVVTFPNDYLGAPFLFIDQANISHFGVFAAGNVNF